MCKENNNKVISTTCRVSTIDFTMLLCMAKLDNFFNQVEHIFIQISVDSHINRKKYISIEY